MIVQVPVYAIHHNPEFHPDPYRFNPERFLPENRDKIIPYTYLPFGGGPRNCVGMRFALMEAKTAVVRIIKKYRFTRSENTKIPLQYRKNIALLQATDIVVGVEMRN
jgi:thromboxane-A synthase